jgi:hypothetical protein
MSSLGVPYIADKKLQKASQWSDILKIYCLYECFCTGIVLTIMSSCTNGVIYINTIIDLSLFFQHYV